MSPSYGAGGHTFAVQAPTGTTAASLQTELAATLGTVQALPYTAIPLALEDPNAATLWSVTVVLTGATNLSALNAVFNPAGDLVSRDGCAAADVDTERRRRDGR